MILELKFNGFRLFKNETTLSFCADARTKKLLSNASYVDERYVNKCLGIYGSNNSGKSNLIKLFLNLKQLLSGMDSFEFNRLFFNDDKNVSISLTYNNLDNLGWLKYEFVYDSYDKKFISEKLSSIKFYFNGKPFEKVIFEKNLEDKIFKVFDIEYNDYLNIVRSNLPLFYAIEIDGGTFASLKEYRDSFKNLSDSIEVVSMYNIPISKTIDFLKENEKEKKDFVLAFVRHADLSVDDFKYDLNDNFKIDFSKFKIDEKALEQYKDLFDSFHLKTKYGNSEVPSLFFDSSGTKKIEAIASYVYEAIKQGKTLVIDELDNGLHYKVTRAIVSAFNNLANKKGQLVFTAHDLLLIDCNNLMRKDQIYFLERNRNGASLFCLKEATVSSGGPREGADLIKRYNHGDFVEVPSPSFIEQVLKIVNNQ